MAKFEIKGLDKLKKQLKQMEKGARELDGKHKVPINELLTPAFMKKYTGFSDFDAFMDASGFPVETNEDFESIPEDQFNRFVAANTPFRSWDTMLEKATDLYVKKKMGL